jgi:hypothetical protein
MLFTPVSNIVSGLIRLKSTAYVKDLTVSDVVLRTSFSSFHDNTQESSRLKVKRVRDLTFDTGVVC